MLALSFLSVRYTRHSDGCHIMIYHIVFVPTLLCWRELLYMYNVDIRRFDNSAVQAFKGLLVRLKSERDALALWPSRLTL
jgi:hypothetical protein